MFNADIRNGFLQYGQSLSLLQGITGDVASNTQLLANAVVNLTPKQQALALATKGLTQEEIARVMSLNISEKETVKQAIADATLINSKKKLTTKLAEEVLTIQLGDEAKVKSIMQSAGIVAADETEVISKKKVSVAILQEKLAQEGLSATQIKAITTQLGLSATTVNLSNYFKGLTASTWASVKAIGAWLVTNPVGWCVLAAGAIAGVVAVVDLCTVSLEEQRKKTKELQEEYEQTSSDLSDVETQLSEVKERIVELNKLDHLSFVEQEELDNLKSTNDLLERQVELLKQKKEFEGKAVRESIQKEYDKGFDFNTNTLNYYLYKNLTDIQRRMTNGELVTDEEIEYYNQFADKIDVAKESIVDDALEISDYIDRMIEAGADESDPFLIKLKEQFEEIDRILNPATYKTRDFENIINTNQFKTAVDEVNELAKSGQLSLEKLQSEFPNLVEAFGEAGISAKEAVSQFYSAINPNGEEYGIPSITVDVTKLKGNLSKTQEQIADVFKNTDLFDKAKETLSEGSSLSFDDITNLLAVDSSLAGKFIQTADGYTIALEALSEARQNYIDNTQKALQADIDSAKSSIQIAENNIKELKVKRDALNPASNIKEWKAYDDAIRSEKKNIEELNGVIDTNNLYLQESKNAHDGAASSVKSFSDLIGEASKKTSLLKTVMSEMTDTGHISASTYASLLEQGSEYAKCIEIQNGHLVVNVDKLKDLEAQEYRNVKSANKLRQAELSMMITSNQGKVEQWVYDEINRLERENKAIDEAINAVYDTTPDSGSGKSEKPKVITDFEEELAKYQHEINMGRKEEDAEYYDWLENAAKEAYKGQTDYLDELWKYEEQVYAGRKKLAEDYYKDRISELEDQIDTAKNDNIDRDGNKLKPQEKFDYILSTFDEIIATINGRINQIVQNGVEGHRDELKELEKQLEEYTKKKAEVFTDEIEYEKKHLERLQQEYNDLIDEQIDRIKDKKDAIESSYDAEIDKIDETIKALKNKNEEDKSALDLAQAQLDVEKAKQDLEKAKQRTRKVYGADGAVSYRQDPDKISGAQKSLADAQQKVTDLTLEQIISAWEKQKEALEAQKDAELKEQDGKIDELNNDKENSPFKTFLEILEAYIDPKDTENLPDVWKKIFNDKDKVQVDDGKITVNGQPIDTSKVNENKLTAEETNDTLGTAAEKLEEAADKLASVTNETMSIEDVFKHLGFDETTAKNAAESWMSSGFTPNVSQTVVPNLNSNSSVPQGYTINGDNTQNITYNFGDIVVQQPVGDANALAKALVQQLPNAFQNQQYTNLKRK